MAMTINTNVASLNAQRNLSTSQGMMAQSIQRLSSGLRVNSAKDDAAGLAIAERMQGQIKGFSVATRNASDAISLAQTAEGALSTIGDNLQRMRELAVQSSNGTNSTTDRTNLNAEFSQLAAEITRTIGGTSFNSTNLFGATAASGFTFQIGANNVAATDQISVSGTDLTTNTELASGGTVIGGNISTLATAQAMLADIDTAINTVTTQRSTWGATQNRFEAVISNLKVTSENLAAARGRIMDTDFATETANLTKSQILQQAGTAMLAQANQTPQSVLSLLK
jgi:flagellin